MKDELQEVTIRIRKGDREALQTYFHPMKYNRVIRNLVARMVDNIRADRKPLEEVTLDD